MNAELTAALAANSAAFIAATGETVTIGGVNYTARVKSILHDQSFMPGGLGDGDFQITLTKAALATKPARNTVVVARGLTRNVLDVTERDARWLLTVGLPGS